MKHTAFLLSSLLLGGIAASCGGSSTQAPRAEQPVVAVTMGRAEIVDLPSSFESGGVVRARSTAVISSRIMAPVVEVHVRAGDRVRRGTPLVTLDGREIAARQAQAASSLTSATEAARAAESAVASADAALTLARVSHDRVRTLHDKRSATSQELDQAVAALNEADARASAARAQLAAATSARDAAQSAGEAATVTRSYSTLTAPFDGVVSLRSVDPGSMATPGAPLLTIEDATAFQLEVTIDEAHASQVKRGDAVDVRFADPSTTNADAAVRASVAEVARIDPASHGFVVKLDLPSDRPWRSGSFARAIFTGPSRQALAVPDDAVFRRGQITFVFTVNASGHATLQPVSSGVASGHRVEVLAGVHAGDRVVLHPPATLTDGAPVEGGRQ